MSPDLRSAVVIQRLATMRELLDVLDEEAEVSGDALRADLRRRLVVERALSSLVEAAVQINNHVVAASGAVPAEEYYTSFLSAAETGLLPRDLAARLAPSAGLRNRVVREYERVDLDIVAAAIPDAVRDFREYVSTVAAWLEDR